MFYGEYAHTIDLKGRLILPAKFRDVAKDHSYDRYFLTRGLDRCIFMFSENEWVAQEQKFKNLSFTRQEARMFNRMFFAGACDVTLDKQGRFIIPNYLKDFAEVKRDCVLIGVSNRIEIWDKKLWSDYYTSSNENFEKTAETMLDL